MRKTYLAKAIEATEGASTEYDANVKFLLADRQILAYIIKYSVTEFTNSNYDDLKKSTSIKERSSVIRQRMNVLI